MAALSTKELAIVARVVGWSSVVVSGLGSIVIIPYILPWWLEDYFTVTSAVQFLGVIVLWQLVVSCKDTALLRAFIDENSTSGIRYFVLLGHVPFLTGLFSAFRVAAEIRAKWDTL